MLSALPLDPVHSNPPLSEPGLSHSSPGTVQSKLNWTSRNQRRRLVRREKEDKRKKPKSAYWVTQFKGQCWEDTVTKRSTILHDTSDTVQFSVLRRHSYTKSTTTTAWHSLNSQSWEDTVAKSLPTEWHSSKVSAEKTQLYKVFY